MTQERSDYYWETNGARGYPETVVEDMVNLYELNLIDREYISPEVKNELADLFDSVPAELKAYVFRSFRETLEHRSLPFVIDVMEGNA